MSRYRKNEHLDDGRSKVVRERTDIEMERHYDMLEAHGTADKMYEILKKHTTPDQMRKICADLIMLRDPGYRSIVSRLLAQHNAGVNGTDINTPSRIFTRVVKVKPGPRPRAKKNNTSR